MNNVSSTPPPDRRLWWILALVALSSGLSEIPVANLLVGPITTFVTTIHELSHALVCLATGGWVSGITIVADGAGHGGLTFTHGGNPWLINPAGYLGTTLVGCLLISVSGLPRLAKFVLFLLGCTIGLATLVFGLGAVFTQGRILEGLGSIFWGLIMSGFFVWAAFKLRPGLANLLLLFLAVQTGLNALSDVFYLAKLSMGLAGPGGWSDATNMAQLSGIPAFVWAILWAVIAVSMIGFTLLATFRTERRTVQM